MIKKNIKFTDYMNDIVRAMQSGVLLTTKADNKINSMVIGGGTLGSCWGKPIFTVYPKKARKPLALAMGMKGKPGLVVFN